MHSRPDHSFTIPCRRLFLPLLLVLALFLQGCSASRDMFMDPNMDFGAIRTVALLPLNNLTKDQQASDRVRDVLANAILAGGDIYVVPVGEVSRGLINAGIMNPVAPSTDEVLKIGKQIKVDGVITGTLKEYGEVRSGTAVSEVISLSLQLQETQTGRVVWYASSTRGGISVVDRMFGGGGAPLNDITEKAVNDLVKKLYE